MSPGAGILAYVFFAGAIFIIRNLTVFIVVSSTVLVLMIILPQRQMKSGVLPITLFLAATFLANVLFSPGKILFQSGPFSVTDEGIQAATLRTLRVFLLIAGAKFLALIAGLDEMVDAMGRMLSPLEKIGVPVRDFFGTMSLAVRALPLIRKKISEAYGRQMTDTEKRTIAERIRVVFRFLLPVLLEGIKDPRTIFNDLQNNGAVKKKKSLQNRLNSQGED